MFRARCIKNWVSELPVRVHQSWFWVVTWRFNLHRLRHYDIIQSTTLPTTHCRTLAGVTLSINPRLNYRPQSIYTDLQIGPNFVDVAHVFCVVDNWLQMRQICQRLWRQCLAADVGVIITCNLWDLRLLRLIFLIVHRCIWHTAFMLSHQRAA